MRAVLFDKDGTLFDFQTTWGGWASDLMADYARGDAAVLARLDAAFGIDVTARRFRRGSPFVAGTEAEGLAILKQVLPDWAEDELVAVRRSAQARARPVPVGDVAACLDAVAAFGCALAVVTNDNETDARAQLADLGVLDRFGTVIGYDSGFGSKPAPGMCLGAATALGVAPAACVMVGDSTHDLHAGRAAGMACVGVLTGVATREDLAPHADVVLDDIHGLPAWLAASL